MKSLEADIAVVAAGTAGLSAAIAAAQRGLKVLVFEKGATTGGTGNMGMGPLGIESRHTRMRNFGPTKDQAFEIFMNYTHWRVDAKLVRAYLSKSGDTIHWLEALGVQFVEPASYFAGSFPTWHLVKPATGVPGPTATATMMKILTDRAKEMGIRIMLQTPARKLLKQGDRVVGVLAEDKSGEEIEARAKAVIVATGGFGNNLEMIKKYTGFEWGKNLFSFRIPGLEGDGIRMAWEAGAASTEMNIEMTCSMPEMMRIPSELASAFRQPHLMVNLLGERFMNEGIVANTTFAGNAVSQQKDCSGFMIFDSAIAQEMENGFDFMTHVFPVTHLKDFEKSVDAALATGYKHLFVADSIEELAAKTGIDAARLMVTLAEYNRDCRKGYDELFNKEHKYLRPIEQPRFYAGRFYPSGYGTLGGIKINHRAEVTDKNFRPISGLYAAGTDACSIYGDSYCFILPGNTMGFAINTGRIAAESAAEYVRAMAQTTAGAAE